MLICMVWILRIAVHPRSCGEHCLSSSLGLTDTGSSPQLRGTSLLPDPYPIFFRFIPAAAGNIYGTSDLIGYDAVHPRSCGEHASLRPISCLNSGSSPQLRGTYPAEDEAFRSSRFIPAAAGNILREARKNGWVPVHPRSCGEHLRG